MPNLPKDINLDIDIDRQGIVDLLLVSIAFEELSLANIVNAECELLKMYLKKHQREDNLSKEGLIKLNRSISDTLRTVLEKEKTLRDKLIHVIQFYEDQD